MHSADHFQQGKKLVTEIWRNFSFIQSLYHYYSLTSNTSSLPPLSLEHFAKIFLCLRYHIPDALKNHSLTSHFLFLSATPYLYFTELNKVLHCKGLLQITRFNALSKQGLSYNNLSSSFFFFLIYHYFDIFEGYCLISNILSYRHLARLTFFRFSLNCR